MQLGVLLMRSGKDKRQAKIEPCVGGLLLKRQTSFRRVNYSTTVSEDSTLPIWLYLALEMLFGILFAGLCRLANFLANFLPFVGFVLFDGI